MRNKKKFTAIVILGIIMLIGTSLIFNVINDGRKGAFRNSAYGIIESAEKVHIVLMMEGNSREEISFTYVDGVETPSMRNRKLDYGGTKPNSGTVVINSDGKVGIAIHNGKWCALKGFDDQVVKLTKMSAKNCESVSIQPGSFKDESGASIPVLEEGMIPIIWDGAKWVKSSKHEKWYDYSNKEWANVVLVTEGSRNNYLSAESGAEIKEADVLAYLVWIPRYKYKLFNVDAVVVPEQEIEIVFESKGTAKSKGNTNGTYLTHPAFTFGDDELDGFWVGKFELTGNAKTPTVKPNTTSLRNQTVSVQFATHQLFNNATKYGITSTADAHMLKNMEWGAITYLSHSKYGKNEEIWINPSSDFMTGCTGTGPSVTGVTGCSNSYQTTNGMKGSTTGNITGVYDMSGGAWDRVMGAIYNSGKRTINVSSSGFAQATVDSRDTIKYLDKYDYGKTHDNQAAYNRRHLGDATGEVRGWYADYATFVYSNSSWFARGGSYGNGVNAGSFAFSRTNGNSGISSSSRLAVGVLPS